MSEKTRYRCPHCNQLQRKSRAQDPKLIIQNTQVAAVKFVAPLEDERIHELFVARFGDACSQITHAVSFEGKAYPEIVNNDKLFIPGQDAGMIITCGTSSAINRSGGTSILFHEDGFYFMLSYNEMGIPGKSNAPEVKHEGSKIKPLQIASSAVQQEISEALSRYNDEQVANE